MSTCSKSEALTSFFIYETVSLPIRVTDKEGNTGILKDCKNVILSFEQKRILILEKDMASPDVAIDGENDIINLYLSQEDTGMFKPGEAKMQLNILYEDEERDVSSQATILVFDNMHKEVMN